MHSTPIGERRWAAFLDIAEYILSNRGRVDDVLPAFSEAFGVRETRGVLFAFRRVFGGDGMWLRDRYIQMLIDRTAGLAAEINRAMQGAPYTDKTRAYARLFMFMLGETPELVDARAFFTDLQAFCMLDYTGRHVGSRGAVDDLDDLVNRMPPRRREEGRRRRGGA